MNYKFLPFIAALASLGSSLPLGSPEPYRPSPRSKAPEPERKRRKAARAARRLDKRSRRK